MNTSVSQDFIPLTQPFIYSSKSYNDRIKSSLISKNELKELYTILSQKSNEAAEKEITLIPNCPDDIKAAFKHLKNKLWVQIWGENNEYISGDHESVFDNTSSPKKITRIVYNSYQCYQIVSKSTMHNWFELQLDFKKTPVFDLSRISDQSNQNNSYFKVQGTDKTWVGGAYQSINEFFKDKKLFRNWLYSPLTYDALLYILFFPLVFRFAYIFGLYLKISTLPTLLMIAIYIYTFIISLYVFRFLFNYTKWVFPVIEFKNGSSLKHRIFLFAVLISIIGSVSYDLFKLIPKFLIGSS